MNENPSQTHTLIAATNRDPASMVKEILFREDLLYRLNTIPIKLPPLRERMEDMEELAGIFIKRVCQSLSCDAKSYSQEFISTLQNYDWPGNIRQLINTVESAVSVAFYEPILFSKHLPPEIRIKAVTSAIKPPQTGNGERNMTSAEPATAVSREDAGTLPTFKDYRRTILQQAERAYLKRLMKLTHGNIKKSCAISGLGRTRLYTLLKENDIDRMGWE